MKNSFKDEVEGYFMQLQDEICGSLQTLDGKSKFTEDKWAREEGGGGRSRIIQQGDVFEKGGVNFSAVHGKLPGFLHGTVNEKSTRFFATGLSIVLHPFNPFVPIIHMNVRYFETDVGDAWFGGGIDLTPIYVKEWEARFFHEVLKNTSDAFDKSYYPKFKSWADDYFFIAHRNETRGIGGIFFDHLVSTEEHTLQQLFEFTKGVGQSFLPAYTPIAEANRSKTFSQEQKQWQLIRRGRYVEFNLVYDRGTRFGLETNGRIESILMSLPEHASWVYNHQPLRGSEEALTLSYLRKGVDWVGMKI
ncbi:MAG: oxygen-dependent coproporphyrinogen oxidase [Flavobacteriales bacterium]|nr:oxygen-dependent coproporphyrinogen oxidase [Flavobacteriales bacterium]